ncbi:MAG: RNA 3'-phosphate cyclase [Nitrospiraceae bacterium]|nr:RNA 3'-phosphate cyclase [Nitrospiraceae bacterium]
MDDLLIDGSQHSGSGTIVRQSVALSALTGRPIHVINARARRDKPGLRLQHIKVVEAMCDLVNGTADGLTLGSREFIFRPGMLDIRAHHEWDIGSAGSTTMLAIAILPVLAFSSTAVEVVLHGGLFQDFAPTVHHLQHVLLPLLGRMGLHADLEMIRPGYVPRGQGILKLSVTPVSSALRPITLTRAGPVTRIWGIALASHLSERRVADRMAVTVTEELKAAGYRPSIDVVYDKSALQRGAALAVFADLTGAARVGADGAGAPGRTSESIGKTVAQRLLHDLKSGASLDRYTADKIIPFAALADGVSRVRIPEVTDHVLSNAWLARLFLEADVTINNHEMIVNGRGLTRSHQWR